MNKVLVNFYLGDKDYHQEMDKRNTSLMLVVDSVFYRCGEIGLVNNGNEIDLPVFNDSFFIDGIYFSDFEVLPNTAESNVRFLNLLSKNRISSVKFESMGQPMELAGIWDNK